MNPQLLLFISVPLSSLYLLYYTNSTLSQQPLPLMWPWRIRTTPPPPSRSRSCSFSCSSFKDIQTLLQPEPVPEPGSPKSPSLFRRPRVSTSLLRSISSRSSVALPPESDHGDAVVVYYTSLRVVRRTFNDCRAVRSILRGFAVAIDERDVCIDNRFLEELQGILGRRNVPLPSVFVGGVYIGGADDVRRMHESGELKALIERLPRSEPYACDSCGGLRFVVCDECDGSHKVFTEKSGFRSCISCNVNGLIRCPACFFVLPRHSK
ncbi:uncharacterized protein At5g39865-like [Gastrolobium bilobum]|uniref:uncharacterized protein At5g39865-like n=1 Tax=Gastrolobium bilobum TaxID=150636 RepID=UPI002AB05DB7|nr:uncharacterized protein At5g39865-like [Gastrolobium bilobum]